MSVQMIICCNAVLEALSHVYRLSHGILQHAHAGTMPSQRLFGYHLSEGAFRGQKIGRLIWEG